MTADDWKDVLNYGGITVVSTLALIFFILFFITVPLVFLLVVGFVALWLGSGLAIRWFVRRRR